MPSRASHIPYKTTITSHLIQAAVVNVATTQPLLIGTRRLNSIIVSLLWDPIPQLDAVLCIEPSQGMDHHCSEVIRTLPKSFYRVQLHPLTLGLLTGAGTLQPMVLRQ